MASYYGVQNHKKIETLQKKAIRLITNSEFISLTNPLFIRMKILKIQDNFKLRLLKLYYKLSYNLLPIYFNRYRETSEQQPARYLRQHHSSTFHKNGICRMYAIISNN